MQKLVYETGSLQYKRKNYFRRKVGWVHHNYVVKRINL